MIRFEQDNKNGDRSFTVRKYSDVLGYAKVYSRGQSVLDYLKNKCTIQSVSLFKFLVTDNVSTDLEITEEFIETKKLLGISFGYSYSRFIINDNIFSVYHVPLGSNKDYYVFYLDEEFVGVIHKEDLEINRKIILNMYSEHDIYQYEFCVYALYLNSTFLYDFDANLGYKTKNASNRTLSKHIKSKINEQQINNLINKG